jgi:four helix bundle protein
VKGDAVVPYRRGHKRLEVWQESVALATHIYQVTELFPKTEVYGLISQMRRAVVSVPSNIAEGAARHSSKEFSHFLSIAGGSLSELDTQIEIACNLNYLSADLKLEIDRKIDSITGQTCQIDNNGQKEHLGTTSVKWIREEMHDIIHVSQFFDSP